MPPCCIIESLPLFGVGGPAVGGVAPTELAATVGDALAPVAPLPLLCVDGDFILSFMASSFRKRCLLNQEAVVVEEYPPTTLTLMTTSPTAAASLRLC